MVAHTFDLSTPEAEAGGTNSEFQVSFVYMVVSRIDQAVW